MTNEPLKVIVRKNVRRLRERAGMTQEQLAAAIGTKAPYISDIERGVRSPGLDVIEKIAAALAVPPDLLLRKMPEMATKET